MISMCLTLDAFNALGNLVGSPPLLINETIVTLEHVMERLDAIEKKLLTEDPMEIIDKSCILFPPIFGKKWEIFLSY